MAEQSKSASDASGRDRGNVVSSGGLTGRGLQSRRRAMFSARCVAPSLGDYLPMDRRESLEAPEGGVRRVGVPRSGALVARANSDTAGI